MDKKGVVNHLLFELSYIVFATAVSVAALYFVFTVTSDTSLQARIYQKDIEQTLNTISRSPAHELKVTYELPENFKFIQKNSQIYISDGEIELAVNYDKNVHLKFTREKNNLILEKNEKFS